MAESRRTAESRQSPSIVETTREAYFDAASLAILTTAAWFSLNI
jgi:hypothetical protein